MAVNSVLAPYPTFSDSTGAPLENGSIYIGVAGFEARTTPKASFFDVPLTIPTGTASGAAIRTSGGFPVNQSGSPAMFYVDGDYSISVTDRNGVLLYSALNNTLALNVGAAVGPVLWADGNLSAVGGGFVNESNTGFARPSANTMQTVVGGVLVSTQTSGGTVFQQPVSGAGFDSGVLAVAQPLDADLTQISAIARSRGALIRGGASAWEGVTLGAAGTVVQSDGTDVVFGSRFASGTVVTTTGTISVDLSTSIPSWARRLTIMMRGVSLSGTDNILVQVGDSGGYITSGYLSASESSAGASQGTVDSGSGFVVFLGSAARALDGYMTLNFFASGEWVATHEFRAGSGELAQGGGSVAGAGTVDRIRLISTGANTFDAMRAVVIWE